MQTILPNILNRAEISANYPITLRLPSPGERDPLFGLPRAKYYALEADGRITLLRLRGKGKSRGTTLIPVAEMLRVLQEDSSAPRYCEHKERNFQQTRKAKGAHK
jgi:hypothetical protein